MGRRRKRRRPEKRVPETSQRQLPFVADHGDEPVETGGRGRPVFRKGKDPSRIFVGETTLPDYLRSLKLGWVLRLRKVIWSLDYSGFFARYEGTGRHPFHPALLVGLIMYGMLKRQWSLRELEGLARVDVGAWLMCGGIQPDHSTIGNFIVRHKEELTEEFFVQSTRTIAAKLKVASGTAAIDGTVIEAAASHYKTLTAEAAREAVKKAQTAAQKVPTDAEAAAKAAAAEQAAKVAGEREEQRKSLGRDPKSVRVSPTEPEAAVQKQKNQSKRPSYKPSIMGHESGLIVGQGVDPTSETAVVWSLLEQHEAVVGAKPELTLLDAGYFSTSILMGFVSRDLDVLIPAGKARGDDDLEKRPRKAKKYLKSQFSYDEAADHYCCPAGQVLARELKGSDKNGKYVRYRGVACGDCPMKQACTSSDKGRTVKRYQGDELKEAMIEVLRHPQARRHYRSRSPLAERPLAELKSRQGLRRFHRRGRGGAALEFSLHCLAFNLGVVVSARRAVFIRILVCTSHRGVEGVLCGAWTVLR